MRSHPFVNSALLAAVLFIGFLFVPPAFAADPLVGTWKLVSLDFEDVDTKQLFSGLGPHPGGFEILTADGHFMVLITAEGRKPTQTDADRVAAFTTLLAQAGTYRVEGGKVILTVEFAKEPGVVGKELTYDVKVEGNRRTSIGIAAQNPALGKKTRPIIVWERVMR
jgi:hypothetical protein